MYASFANVLFRFDNGTDNDLFTYEYELYEEDDIVNPNTPPYALVNGATPHRSGAGNSSVFAVPVEGSYIDVNNDNVVVQKNFFGRVRAVDTSGNVGNWTSIAKTDPSTPLIDSQYIVSLTADKIKAGEIESAAIVLGGASPTNTIIKSKTYDTSSGAQGWFIRGDGHFVLGGSSGISYNGSTVTIGSGVNVNAQINANSISVGNGTYGYLTIDENIGPTNTDFGIELGDPDYNYWYANGNFRVGNSTVNVRFNGSSLSINNANLQLGSVVNNDYAEITSNGDFLVVGYDGSTGVYGSSRFYGPWFNVKKGAIWSANAANAQLMWDNLVFYKSTPGAYGVFIAGGNDTGNAFIDVGATGITTNNSISCSGWFRSSGNSGWYNQTHGGGIWMDESTTVKVYADKNFSTAGTITGGTLSTGGAVYASNWFRSYGVSGWYNETYGGGIYMDDSTWVNVYNGKSFYVPGELDVDGVSYMGGTIYAADSISIGANRGYRSDGNFSTTTSTTITARIVDGGGFQVIRAQSSMRDIKDDIQPISGALDKLLRLRPVSFVEKPEGWENELGLQLKSLDRHFGLIAEEVAEDLPELATYGYPGGYPMKLDEDGKEVVDQEELIKFEKYVPVSWREMGAIPLLIKAVQELSLKIDELESRMV
jgi:hypothetical protein